MTSDITDVSSRNEAKLATVARSCAKHGARAVVFACDVSDETSVAQLAGAVAKKFGVVDVLINNAGRFAGAPFTEMTVADFDAMIGANAVVTCDVPPGAKALAEPAKIIMPKSPAEVDSAAR